MRTLMLVAVGLVALGACGSQSEQGPDPVPYQPTTESTQSPPRSSGRLKAKVTTIGDVAKALGIHADFMVAAARGCYRMRKCGHDYGDLEIACDAIVALEWCKVNDCTEGFLSGPIADDPCAIDISDRPCDDLQRVVECPRVEERGLILYMDAWPEGEVEDPYNSL